MAATGREIPGYVPDPEDRVMSEQLPIECLDGCRWIPGRLPPYWHAQFPFRIHVDDRLPRDFWGFLID